MLSLYEFQKQFVDGLNNSSDAILCRIKINSDLSEKEHLAIYQNSIFGALQKTLQEVYPVCNKLVGDEFFIAMINIYIENNISCSPDLADYGAEFSDFITTFKAAKSLPYLADVARLEWAWHRIQSVVVKQRLDFEKLAACYATLGEKIIFSLPENSFLFESIYPIHRIWEICQGSHNGHSLVLPNNMKFYFLVWRKESTMHIDILTPIEWQFLKYIQAGLTLGEIYLQTKEIHEINLEEILPNIVANGWLADFTIKK